MSLVELTTLGKSCEFFNGKAHEKSIDENGKYIVVNSKFISQEGRVVKRTKEQMFPLYKGDIVMVMSDVPNGKALAKCFIIDKDDTYSLNQRICCIRSKEFDTKYLYYQLNRHEHFLAFNNGENQTNLRKDDILDCPLIKPSMAEQKRIVKMLDESLEIVDRVKVNLIRNLNNSIELFTSELKRSFESKSENWTKKRFDKICVLQRGFDLPTHSRINGDYPLVSSNGITDYIDKFKVTGPGVITGRSGTIGNVHYLENAFWPLNTALYIKDFHGNNERAIYYFLLYVDLSKYSSGAGVPTLNRNHVHSVQFYFPNSTEEQKMIVSKLDFLKIESSKLYSRYESKLEYTEELKSGIIKKAFENELI